MTNSTQESKYTFQATNSNVVCVATRDRFFFSSPSNNEWDEFCRMKTREDTNSLYHFCFLFALISFCVLFRNFVVYYLTCLLSFFSVFFYWYTYFVFSKYHFSRPKVYWYFFLNVIIVFCYCCCCFCPLYRNVFVSIFRVPSFSVRVYQNIDQNAQIHPFQTHLKWQ